MKNLRDDMQVHFQTLQKQPVADKCLHKSVWWKPKSFTMETV